MKPQMTNHSPETKSRGPKSIEANGGSKMFNYQQPNQFHLKDLARILQFGLIILMAILCAVSCGKNPVSPSPGPDPHPSQDELSVSISANPTSGVATLTASFSSEVRGGSAPFTYAWKFGDGSSSTSSNPAHTFTTAGTYNVLLIVSDASYLMDTASVSITVSAASGPACAASANPTSGPAPLAVSFNGSASGGTAPYSYNWNFGDGSTSSLQNPSHIYQLAGTHTARLTVTDSNFKTASKTISITITEPLSLNCAASANPTSGPAPLAVSFNGSASGGTAPYSYYWSFGDGSSSSLQNPSHTYQSAGTYTARLMVTDAASVSCIKTISITSVASTPLSCNATADKTSGTAPLAIKFSGSALGGRGPHNYLWSFGDGSTSTQSSPSHTYQSAGNFTARLTVTDANAVTCTKTIAISATAAASLECTASASQNTGRMPVSISFTGTATNGSAPYTYNWQFGDGGSSSQQNPSHTYQSVGNYNVRLTVTDASSATCTKSVAITIFDAPEGPILSGPATVTNDFQLSWSFTWPQYLATGEGISVEQSTTSSSSGFTQISTVTRSQGSRIAIMNRVPGTYYFRVKAFVNQGQNRGWTQYSNVVRVIVQAVSSKTRFVNNTSYIIISLTIDGVQYFTNNPMGILPGNWFELDLSPGSHNYTAANGYWDGSSRFEMYNWTGSVYQSSGELETVTFNDASINQLLTRWETSGYWEGDFWENLQPHKAGFRFYSNGTWRLYVDGISKSTGTYRLVRRNPGSFSVIFSIGSYEATFYETQGRFVMRNGPSGWPLIDYYYKRK